MNSGIRRKMRGQKADRDGRSAEALAAERLQRDGWVILARRLRTPAGEIDLVVDREGLTAMVEVKSRPTMTQAAFSLQPRQQKRLLAAGDAALAMNPEWGRSGVRFDVMLVDGAGQMRRIADAFRAGFA